MRIKLEVSVTANRWRAIAADLRERIERGEWASGDRLPTNRQLMDHYDTTSQATVARAIAALVAEGVLVSDPVAPRRGVHVRSRHLVRRDLVAGLHMEYERAAMGNDEDADSVGLFEAATGTEPSHLSVDVTYDSAVADNVIAQILGTTEGAALLRRTFRYAIKGTPHQLVTSYMTREVSDAAGLVDASNERVGRGTIAQLRSVDIHIDSVTIEIEARLPTASEVRELAIPAGVPVFANRRVMRAAGQPVEVSFAVVPGDRIAYTLNVDLAKEAVA